MSPFRLSRLFRNRWAAALWAAGICWSAVQFVGLSEATGTSNTDATSDAGGNDADVARLQALVARLGQ